VRLKRPIENRADLQAPECTPDSLEIPVIKIESLEGLNNFSSKALTESEAIITPSDGQCQ
jgi:hypothetical protein